MADLDPALIHAAIDRALAFVVARQPASGLFPTLASPDPGLTGAAPVESVYLTTYIVHAMAQARVDSEATGAARAGALRTAARALIHHGEPGGIWRFFGTSAPNPTPDFDDTACALVALRQCGVPVDSSIDRLLAQCTFPGGGYGTWVDPRLNHPRRYDAGVNANVLLYLAMAGRPTEPMDRYLVDFAERRRLTGISSYALTDPPVIYMLMRAFRHGPAPALAALVPLIPRVLLPLQRSDGSFGHELDTAFAVTALLDSGYRGPELAAAARWLLAQELPGGGWPARTFFRDFLPTYYGSEELTAAICAEALTKLAAGA